MSVQFLKGTPLSATVRPRRWSAATARSTGCAGHASIPAPASRRCSAGRSTAVGRSPPQPPMPGRHGAICPARWCSRPCSPRALVSVAVIEFMPPRGGVSDLVRLVVGRRGRVAMHTTLILRFDYGSAVPWVSRLEDGALRAVAGPDMAILHTPVAVHGEGLDDAGRLLRGRRRDGAVRALLCGFASGGAQPASIPMRALADTEAFWVEWSSRGGAAGPWTEAVQRSLITLKALTYSPTGGIVAAPTTSLPEHPGGQRNWDYRFCWLRDATLTLLALMNAGYLDEARCMARLAAARRRRQSVTAADHVRARRRAATDRVGGAVAAGLRRLAASADRQWRPRPASARRLWRDDGRAASGPRPRHGRRRSRLGAGMRALLEHLEHDLAPAGRGHLGDARAAPALHLLQGDGLGGVRPRGAGASRHCGWTGRSEDGGPTARRDPCRGLRAAASTRDSARSCRPMARGSSTPACCCCRRWASCRPTTRASSAPWPPSSGG